VLLSALRDPRKTRIVGAMSQSILDRCAEIRAHIAQGRLECARELARSSIEAYPGDYRLWFAFSEALVGVEQRIEALRRAETLAPDNLQVLIRLARLFLAVGRRAEAMNRIERAVRVGPDSATTFDSIGALYSALDEPTRALPYFLKAVTMEPSDSHYLFNLAACQRMVGDLQQAVQNCDRAIARDAAMACAYYLRSDLSRARRDCNRIREMESLLARPGMRWENERFIRFALAREYEDTADYERSFIHCKAGNDLQRQHMQYDVSKDIATINEIMATYTQSALDLVGTGFPSKEPIFVLGLPRTGTTLVERIVGSHSWVRAAGELRELTLSLTTVLSRAQGERPSSSAERVRNSLEIDLREVGQLYIKHVRERIGGASRRFVDKMPLNYLYCGLIHAALPEAKVIFVDRNPMDACYAIYKTLFMGAYPFSYDLSDLPRYYVAFRQLMAHWMRVLDSKILHVRYEDLVLDFNRQVRRILEFCQLPWESGCQKFHESAAPATTASAVQVRQPLYASSIGKWRHYETQLAPIAHHLEASEIPYG
jgi:tetratricopeptide (TPR) repeat protein